MRDTFLISRSSSTRLSQTSSGWRARVYRGMRRPRSAPAQKAFSPAPVMMATRVSLSASKSSQASPNRTTVSGSMALWTSGRLKVR